MSTAKGKKRLRAETAKAQEESRLRLHAQRTSPEARNERAIEKARARFIRQAMQKVARQHKRFTDQGMKDLHAAADKMVADHRARCAELVPQEATA